MWNRWRGGFAVALIADALANAAVVPLLALLAAGLTSRCDGEADTEIS